MPSQKLSAWELPLPQKAPPATPFFLYSEKRLSELMSSWLDATKSFPIPIEAHFALKANNNPHILKSMQAAGLGVDIVSGGEMTFAHKCGFGYSQMAFSGAGKTRSEIEQAIHNDIGLINIESECELDTIIQIASQKQKKCRVSFRINPDVDAKSHPYISTGLKEHKFGLSLEKAKLLYGRIAKHQFVKAVGVSIHIGSQLLDLSPLEDALTKTIDFAEIVKRNCGVEFEILDVGGGLGVDYAQPNLLPDFEGYARLVKKFAEAWKAIAVPHKARIYCENGRALVGQAGLLVSQVIGVKRESQKNFLVIDAAMTELIRPALYQARHEIFAIQTSQIPSSEFCRYSVVGPVCESADSFGDDYLLPKALDAGSLVGIDTAGAYAAVMASFYNGRDLAAEYWFRNNGQLEQSRPALSFLSTRLV